MRMVGMSSAIKRLMSLQPRELINWFHTQTSHRLNQDDEQAILRHAIGGLVFLEYGTEEYLAKAGISYGSCSVLAALRASVLKKRTTTQAGLDKETSSKRQHVAKGPSNKGKSEGLLATSVTA